jgi:hypothetical protein
VTCRQLYYCSIYVSYVKKNELLTGECDPVAVVSRVEVAATELCGAMRTPPTLKDRMHTASTSDLSYSTALIMYVVPGDRPLA